MHFSFKTEVFSHTYVYFADKLKQTSVKEYKSDPQVKFKVVAILLLIFSHVI